MMTTCDHAGGSTPPWASLKEAVMGSGVGSQARAKGVLRIDLTFIIHALRPWAVHSALEALCLLSAKWGIKIIASQVFFERNIR